MSTATASYTQRYSIYTKLALKVIQSLPHGRMELTLPDGNRFEIGDGNGIHCAVEVKSFDLFRKFILFGDIGFGESYVDGDWEADNLTHFIQYVLQNVAFVPSLSGNKVGSKLGVNLLKVVNQIDHFFNRNNLSGSKKNISEHYDLGNEFYSLWLDDTMTYSSAYFEDGAADLRSGQLAKYERIAQQLKLSASDHVLEIGSGWGSMAAYMAQNYGCRVTTITLSEEQQKLARERMSLLGLDKKVQVELIDYRDVKGQFDKIVSIEMIEAVGAKYMPIYFKQVAKLLKPQGIFTFQAITCPDSRFESLRKGVDWIQKHIFPGSLLPSVGFMNRCVEQNTDLSLVNLKDFGKDYARTLDEWQQNFNAKIDEIMALGFDERFIRKWNYYLSYCSAAFSMRNISVMQLTYVRPNNLIY
ncbi:MAG TPA: cyclopropane-fatty-acyl-phospholipid synthase family protein [Luteibaculaceae bacterium]|nr:cyclopropane-fatty-acyl-phospholipid synthase family protein [Luteibaculaceae bacterium]